MFATPLRALALAASLFLAGCLGPGTPEEQIKVIEEKLTQKLPFSPEQKTELDAAIAEGRKALEDGKKELATTAFDKALEIVKLAEDAALYNKAD